MTPGGGATHTYNVTVIATDRRGLLSKAAGVLALNSLRVHSAAINSASGAAINTFVVSPHFGSPPAAELLRQQFILALDGELDVSHRWRSVTARRPSTAPAGWGETKPAVPVNSAPPRRGSCGARGRPGSASGRDPHHRPDRAARDAHQRLRAFRRRHRLGQDHHVGSSVVDVFGITVPALSSVEDVRSSSIASSTRCCLLRRRRNPVEEAS